MALLITLALLSSPSCHLLLSTTYSFLVSSLPPLSPNLSPLSDSLTLFFSSSPSSPPRLSSFHCLLSFLSSSFTASPLPSSLSPPPSPSSRNQTLRSSAAERDRRLW